MKLSELIDPTSKEEILIASKILKKDKVWILANPNVEVENLDDLKKAIERYRSGYPLHYITKEKEFMGLVFELEEGVFIPRYETEDLVEKAIEIIEEHGLKLIAEIGVGCGAIGISIAKFTGVRVVGTDVSKRAVEISLRNAKKHNVEDLFEVRLGKFLEPFEDIYDEIDMIVSNPPYVEEDYVPPEDVAHEPREAIFSGDGFDFFREFFKRYDVSGKFVLMEFPGKGKERIVEIAKTKVEFLKGIDGVERFFLISPS